MSLGLAYLLALQAAATPPEPPPLVAPIDFDLAALRRDIDAALAPRRRGCAPRDPEEILVCGTRPGGGAYPTAEMAHLFEPRPLVAEIRLGDATGRAYTEAVTIGPGFVSNRIMVGIKLPF